MNESILEHINLTTPDPLSTASMLCELFDWRIRWQGDSIHGGFSVHVGGMHSYLALYSNEKQSKNATDSYFRQHGLNHIGVVVNNLEQVERKVIELGMTPHSHADYEPGKRFYFHDANGLEIEVISYDN
ncbi:VOC family protein [Granulosicoccus antarcticus]|uniref:VOC domain-containing protein n=1 Tax=Granulosicoccus antarcticus IMCC3135 TaxID=1192854 RepID=A0A2Z2P4M2_9GAMM|nr:VOC family protein [Granulosicoccus antarcticus]ASJ74784.1 hypothetical protein IMCC3135_23575 [Granulosicoccus antarcticus IMCC3135]